MSFHPSNLTEALRSGAPISAEDVLAARRWAWSDGSVARAEAEALFALNAESRSSATEWVDFFVEAIVEYVVNQQSPRGYVDAAKADWLIAQIDHDGRLDSLAELELLVKLSEAALNAPPSLKAYALRQVEQAVLTGEGPTRRGGAIRPGQVDEAEVALLRRLIFAGGGDGALVVSRDEAEMLWRLKDACRDGDNAPGWSRLFVQGVGNHLMAYSDYKALDRGEAERLERFMNDRRSSVAGFFGRMARSNPAAALRGMFADTPDEDHATEVAAANAVTPEEAAWLKQRIDADSTLDAYEKALLAFIADESGGRG